MKQQTKHKDIWYKPIVWQIMKYDYLNLRKLKHTPQNKQERSILLKQKKINNFL